MRLKNDVLVFSEVKQEVCCNLVRLKEFKLVLIGEVIVYLISSEAKQ